jgi:aminoglycoside 3-N-acetyltransferase I
MSADQAPLPGTDIHVKRLGPGDHEPARRMFQVIAEVFEEEPEPLRDDYLDRLLGQPTFWAIAAFVGDEIVGGITAHTLPMTRAESSEVFIYDVAVREDHQRRGIGRRLVTALLEEARAQGLSDVFVPADNEDVHALDFYRALGGEPAPVTMFTFPREQA